MCLLVLENVLVKNKINEVFILTEKSAFFEREYHCPICQFDFKSYAIRISKIYVENRESDFHVLYKGVSPLHYSIIVCPSCNYAASNTNFVKTIPASNLEKLSNALSLIKENESDMTKERDISVALRSFQLAIRSSQLKMSPPGELAGLLLAAAWVCREMGNHELEDKYIQQALDKYLEAFEKDTSNLGNLDDLQATFLIGELMLRTGQFHEAINWFSKVVYHKKIKTNPALENLARDQWSSAREQAKSAPLLEKTANEKEEVVVISDNKDLENKKIEPTPLAPKKRLTMQMSVNLYNDQIDWLKNIMNSGHASSKKLVSREEILKTLVDAVQEFIGDQTPKTFSNQEELKTEFLKAFNSLK